jgi:hypothetical protein
MFVVTEAGQDQHFRCVVGVGGEVVRGEVSGGLYAVHAGHADVHDDDVGCQFAGQFDGFGALTCFAYHFEVWVDGQHHAEAATDQCLVVGE